VIKKNTPTHWVGKSGKLYEYDKWQNWGRGIKEKGRDDLPKEDYPYTLKYHGE
jgi:hypothetical protein